MRPATHGSNYAQRSHPTQRLSNATVLWVSIPSTSGSMDEIATISEKNAQPAKDLMDSIRQMNDSVSQLADLSKGLGVIAGELGEQVRGFRAAGPRAGIRPPPTKLSTNSETL